MATTCVKPALNWDKTLPEAARGTKMSRLPPSEAGTTQPHSLSQNSLTHGFSTVFSVMLSPGDKTQI